MKVKLSALLLEDVQKDAEILKEMLINEGFDLRTEIVETEQDFVTCLKNNTYDIIFADFTLPSFNGHSALTLAKEICPGVPFIFVSGTIGEDRAVELLKQGATDYVLKDRMERISLATKRALEAAANLQKFIHKEIELKTNRKLLQTIIDNSVEAIFIKDLKGRYLLFNNAAEKMTGKSALEIIGKDDTFVHTAGEAEKLMATDRKVIKSRNPLTIEQPIILKDGFVHFFQTIKCPIFDDNGNPTGLFGISRDITETKLTNELLTASEIRYRRLFESAKDGILILDADTGIVVDINPYLTELLDSHKEEFIDQAIWEIGYFNDIIKSFDQFLELKQKEYLRIEDVPLVTANGKNIEVEFVSNIYLVNNKKVIQCNIRDITKRKQAERALHRYNERLKNLHEIDQAILQSIESPEAIIQSALQHILNLLYCQRTNLGIIDTETKEVQIYVAEAGNKTIKQTSQILSEEAFSELDIFKQGGIEILDKISGFTSTSALTRLFQIKGINSSITVPLLSAQGFYGVLNIGWKNQKSITSEEIEVANEVASQITIAQEQAHLLNKTKLYATELEKRVEERTAQLTFVNKELEAFSYSVSHDLRAPLRGIHGYTKILMEDFANKLDDEGKRVCAIIEENANKMGQLINDLLAFSKISRSEMLHYPLNMKALINSIYHEITDAKMQERIQLSVGQICDTHADPSLIKQVWANLLSNAIKYSSKKEKTIITISSRKEESRCIYSIKDNGVGFDMKHADKLFGVFKRLHSDREFEGTGVGLAIVQRIILRHGGEVWAEGEVDKGATFYFSLPV